MQVPITKTLRLRVEKFRQEKGLLYVGEALPELLRLGIEKAKEQPNDIAPRYLPFFAFKEVNARTQRLKAQPGINKGVKDFRDKVRLHIEEPNFSKSKALFELLCLGLESHLGAKFDPTKKD